MDIVSNYRFIFTYGAFKAGFLRVSNLGERADIEYICEGGRQGCAYPISSPSKTAGKITLEKGYGLFNPFFDPLKGFTGFSVGMQIILPCTIIVLGENKMIKRLFAFDSGIVSAWECGTLDAVGGEILIDKLEIEHCGLFELACGHFNL